MYAKMTRQEKKTFMYGMVRWFAHWAPSKFKKKICLDQDSNPGPPLVRSVKLFPLFIQVYLLWHYGKFK